VQALTPDWARARSCSAVFILTLSQGGHRQPESTIWGGNRDTNRTLDDLRSSPGLATDGGRAATVLMWKLPRHIPDPDAVGTTGGCRPIIRDAGSRAPRTGPGCSSTVQLSRRQGARRRIPFEAMRKYGAGGIRARGRRRSIGGAFSGTIGTRRPGTSTTFLVARLGRSIFDKHENASPGAIAKSKRKSAGTSTVEPVVTAFHSRRSLATPDPGETGVMTTRHQNREL
jgi:hypothetical protein